MRCDIKGADEVSCHPLTDGLAQLLNSPAAPPDKRPRVLPRLHLCCYKGDLPGVLMCITEGHSLHETITLKNHEGRLVGGVTPLFLAAQRGFTPVCKLLIENGANPGQPCTIQGAAELCTPAEVAQLNLHIFLAYYLRKQVSKRKEEDAVLAMDDAPPPHHDTSGSVYSIDFGGAAGSFFGGRRRRASSSSAANAAAGGGSGDLDEQAGTETPGTAGAVFMQELDLTSWDPSCGEAVAQLDGQKMTKLMKKNHIEVGGPRPDTGAATPAGAAAAAPPPAPARESSASSATREESDFDCHVGPVAVQSDSAADVAAAPAPQRASAKHSKLVSRFLRGVDLRDLDLG